MEDWNEGLLVLEEWRSYRGSRWWLYMPAKAKQSFFCDWRRGREEKTHGPQVKVRLQVVISEMSKCMTLPTSELADIRNNLYLYSTTTILVGSYWTQRGKFFSIAQTWKVFFFFGFIAWWWWWFILHFAATDIMMHMHSLQYFNFLVWLCVFVICYLIVPNDIL